MRACFIGPNIFALGNGVAVLKSVWKEAEPPRPSDNKKTTAPGDAPKPETSKTKHVR